MRERAEQPAEDATVALRVDTQIHFAQVHVQTEQGQVKTLEVEREDAAATGLCSHRKSDRRACRLSLVGAGDSGRQNPTSDDFAVSDRETSDFRAYGDLSLGAGGGRRRIGGGDGDQEGEGTADSEHESFHAARLPKQTCSKLI